MDLTTPARDEVELSVFGRGYGEAICLHMGDGAWAVIDSCINPETADPAALSYLSSLGLVPSDAVRLVVATHWDDDHIRGIGQIVETCTNSIVSCSAALRRREIVAFVLEQDDAQSALGSGLDELRRVLFSVHKRAGTIVWAKANLPLYPLPPGDAPRVVALSPSEDAVERSIVSLIEEATGAKSTLARRYQAPEGPNGASVATSVRNGDITMLLGADLEVSSNHEAGWDGVMKYAKPARKASIVKVPHHGSVNAHHEAIWSDLAETDPVAILSPWALGGRYLPRSTDLARLRKVADRVFLTAMPTFRRARMDPDLEKMIRRLHPNGIKELRGWGHVRARRRVGEASWRVDLSGDAAPVPA